jgi:hypothetical protein
MNAEIEVSRLLKEHAAVLVRGKKHLVYRLPNGRKFVLAKTSSDPARAAKNNLSELRHALGIARPKQNKPKQPKGAVEMQLNQPPAAQTTATLPVAPPAHLLELPQTGSLKDRIEAAVAIEETEQAKLMAEAEAIERRVQMLKAMLPFASDVAAEGALRALLPMAAPWPPAPPNPEPPPQVITERVQVTRQLVFAATQTFEETFTVNDVLALMTNGRHIDPPERMRVRNAIAAGIMSLYERGEVIREAQGIGRQQSVWKKVVLSGSVPVRDDAPAATPPPALSAQA